MPTITSKKSRAKAKSMLTLQRSATSKKLSLNSQKPGRVIIAGSVNASLITSLDVASALYN